MVERASGLTATGSKELRLAMSSLKGVAPATELSPKTMAVRPLTPAASARRDFVRAADQRLRAAVPGHVGDLGRRQHHVDRIDYGAGLQRAIVADDPLPRVRRIERHAVARLDAEPDEARGKRTRQFVELSKTERPSFDSQRGPVAERARRVRKNLSEGIEHGGPLSFRRTLPRLREGRLRVCRNCAAVRPVPPDGDLRMASGRSRAPPVRGRDAGPYGRLTIRTLISSRSLIWPAPYSPHRQSGVHPCEMCPGTRSQ